MRLILALMAAAYAGCAAPSSRSVEPDLVSGRPFDYFAANRALIGAGVQAVLTCNGLFTSNRPLARVRAQELAYLTGPRFDPPTERFTVDEKRRAVSVQVSGSQRTVKAAFREGIGCVVLGPEQTLDDIDALPKLPAWPAVEDVDWPMGDRVARKPLPGGVDPKKLRAASNWAFERASPEQVTLSLMVVHRGDIIVERYADGVDARTRTRTWSTAKSIAVTLIGMLVDRGKMALDAPLDIDWRPELRGDSPDPRRAITLRHVLNMSSGLYPVDSFNMEYATGSGLAYWAGASSSEGARRRGLVRAPGGRPSQLHTF
ncbi:MAG: serine hydrolase, partial [Myxococcota bacterium]